MTMLLFAFPSLNTRWWVLVMVLAAAVLAKALAGVFLHRKYIWLVLLVGVYLNFVACISLFSGHMGCLDGVGRRVLCIVVHFKVLLTLAMIVKVSFIALVFSFCFSIALHLGSLNCSLRSTRGNYSYIVLRKQQCWHDRYKIIVIGFVVYSIGIDF